MITAYGNPDAPIVLIQMVDDHDLKEMDAEVAEIQKLTDAEFYLLAIKVKDWNADLSPWNAPAVFGREDFGNGAADTLSRAMKYTDDKSKTYFIGGYSLAGLFALWVAYQTDVFQGVAAASPSVWFSGFSDYMKERSIQTNFVYLSLGDKEEKTRNPMMSTVGDRVRKAHELLNEQGINTVLEWNQGNHFKDADKRTAKAFAWLLKQWKER